MPFAPRTFKLMLSIVNSHTSWLKTNTFDNDNVYIIIGRQFKDKYWQINQKFPVKNTLPH